MEIKERKNPNRLEDPEFLDKFREKFALELDAGMSKGQFRGVQSEAGELVICGEKIRGNFQLKDMLARIGRQDFHLSPGEIEKLQEIFFEK